MVSYGFTLAQAKRDHARGHFKGYEIHDAHSLDDKNGGWQITLNPTGGFVAEKLVDARTKTVRVFKTLDAAIKTLREIGFPATRFEWKPED